MNWYPTIYHPITKTPINLFSEEINELLEQGYAEDFLLKQKRIIFENPLHNIEDIDYEKMMYMDFKQLKVLCRTNKYANRLCQNKNFWMKKFRYDDLYMPSKELLSNDTNWLKSYYMLNWITNYMRDTSRDEQSKAFVNNSIMDLIHQYFQVDIEDEIKQITFYIYKNNKNEYAVLFEGDDNFMEDVLVEKDVLVDFLYEGLMTGAITELTEA